MATPIPLQPITVNDPSVEHIVTYTSTVRFPYFCAKNIMKVIAVPTINKAYKIKPVIKKNIFKVVILYIQIEKIGNINLLLIGWYEIQTKYFNK
jgi:hypothetical protein